MDFFNSLIYSSITFGVALLISFLSTLLYRAFLKKRLNPRHNTIALLIINVIRYGVLLISVLIVATIFRVDMTALLAGAGFLGLLLGVGLQKLFQDMISGFFIIFENHYIVGEYVTINNVTGLVEEIGLKTTRIKTYEGELYLFSNGSIDHILNYSRYPSLSLVDVHIPYKYHTIEVLKIIKDACSNFENKSIVSGLEVLGVQKTYETYYDIRIICYTKPYEHFAINRQINAYIINELMKNDIFVNVNCIVEIKK